MVIDMPASFPSSVKTWANKQDNIDDVFAGDINGTYHEIIAIENELMQVGYKPSARVATTQNGDLATAFANGQTVDGIVLSTGDRILIKDQTSGAENGIYIVNASGAPSRAIDANTAAHMVPGLMVYVREGAVNGKGTWKLTTTGTITLGTTPLTFENELASHKAENPTLITDLVQLESTTALSVILQKNKTYTITQPVIVSGTVKKFIGNNALILCNFAPSEIVQGGLYFETLTGLEASGFEIKYIYDGYDYEAGLLRNLNGILVEKSANVELHHIKASLFPRTGIELGWDTEYTNDVYIHDVDCSNNRSAGIFYGNVNTIKIERCKANTNGHVSDYGTGYGIAATEGRQPTDITIRDNEANDNYRKGIDFHSGKDLLIDNNTTYGNRLEGIYVDNTAGLDMGYIDIINNDIGDMTNDGSVPAYNSIFGIFVGSRAQGTTRIKTIVNIENNKIRNFGKTGTGVATPIMLEPHGMTDAEITIDNNTIECGNITYLIFASSNVTVAGTKYKMFISRNKVKGISCDNTAIYMQSNKHVRIDITDNLFEFDTYTLSSISTYNENAASLKSYKNNVVNIAGYRCENLFMLLKNSKETMYNNFLNNVKQRDWDGARYIAYTEGTPTALSWTVGSTGKYLTPTTYESWIAKTAGLAGTTWTQLTPYAVGDSVKTPDGSKAYLCTTAGTSGTVVPTGANPTDGTVVWSYSGAPPTFKGVGLIET
jgi:hypothetical protein